MRNFLNQILFPHYCLLCQKEKFLICPTCQKTFKIKKFPRCPVCQKINSNFEICPSCKKNNNLVLDGIFVTGFWEDPLFRKIIYLFKYEFIFEAGKILNKNIVNFVKFHKILSENTNKKNKIILTAVPLHQKRENWRGFNQSEKLCQALAKKFKIQFYPKLLERKKNTPPQMNITDAKSRKLNIYAAFCLGPDFKKRLLRDAIVIIVDDITTTGATLNECAKILKKYKPKKIYGLVLAQA